MSRRTLAILVATPLAVAALFALLWVVLRPTPSLAEAAALAEAKRFDEAEAIVDRLLRDDPSRSDARMLAAQLALDRPAPAGRENETPDPKPALLALDHLAHVKMPNSKADDAYLTMLVALNRGKAQYRLGRLDEAEKNWLEVIRLDPNFPEAGWFLLETYYLQGRLEEARRLALRLHGVETDPHDRVQYLLELVREDAQPTAPASIVALFEKVVARSPEDIRANIALGSALIRAGQTDRGVDILRQRVKAHPDRPEAWDAWLTGLDDAGQVETLATVLQRLPEAIAASPGMAKHKGRAAQERGDWKAAADDYRKALEVEPPDHRVEYRLARALRNAGAIEEAEPLEAKHNAFTEARQEVRALYELANADKTLGTRPRPDLYLRLAENRAKMGLAEEAEAWKRLAHQTGSAKPSF